MYIFTIQSGSIPNHIWQIEQSATIPYQTLEECFPFSGSCQFKGFHSQFCLISSLPSIFYFIILLTASVVNLVNVMMKSLEMLSWKIIYSKLFEEERLNEEAIICIYTPIYCALMKLVVPRSIQYKFAWLQQSKTGLVYP